MNNVIPTRISLSRIDRSVADNLRDIERSFSQDSGIVTDFIIFITKRLKTDLFGYTRFTLNEFCNETGRNKQDLHLKHQVFSQSNRNVPEYFGHRFESVFDYVLFRMLETNIIFSRSYSYEEDGKIIHLENFPILKDIKLNIERNSNSVKIYEVRVSDEVLRGFIKRYYTIESDGYKLVGKGRGGDGRKRLFILLYKTKHIIDNQKEKITCFPLDYIASIAGIEVKENKLRKVSVRRVLDSVRKNGKIDFSYSFVQGDTKKSCQEDYWVEVDFTNASNREELKQPKGEHKFFYVLMEDLRFFFNKTYTDVSLENEKDHFQRWLTNSNVDLDIKSQIVQQAHLRGYGEKLTTAKAYSFVKMGIFNI